MAQCRDCDAARARIAELEADWELGTQAIARLQSKRDLLAARVEWAKEARADDEDRSLCLFRIARALNATDDEVRAWAKERGK